MKSRGARPQPPASAVALAGATRRDAARRYFFARLKKEERARIFRRKINFPGPADFLAQTFPEGVRLHVERLAGIEPGAWAPGDACCAEAERRLSQFHFVTEKRELRRGGIRELVARLARVWPSTAAALSADVPEMNRIAASPRAGAGAAADFEAALGPGGRAAFENRSACALRVLHAARRLPTFWPPPPPSPRGLLASRAAVQPTVQG